MSPMVYQWEHNGTVLVKETSPILSITNVQQNETGIYCCMVTAKNNVSVKSNEVNLTISEPGE